MAILPLSEVQEIALALETTMVFKAYSALARINASAKMLIQLTALAALTHRELRLRSPESNALLRDLTSLLNTAAAETSLMPQETPLLTALARDLTSNSQDPSTFHRALAFA